MRASRRCLNVDHLWALLCGQIFPGVISLNLVGIHWAKPPFLHSTIWQLIWSNEMVKLGAVKRKQRVCQLLPSLDSD
jgi:hypothetical protein